MIKDLNDELGLGVNIKIPQEQEQKLLEWDQIYPCNDCDSTTPDIAPIYHLKDKVSNTVKYMRNLEVDVLGIDAEIDRLKNLKTPIVNKISRTRQLIEDVLSEA